MDSAKGAKGIEDSAKSALLRYLDDDCFGDIQRFPVRISGDSWDDEPIRKSKRMSPSRPRILTDIGAGWGVYL